MSFPRYPKYKPSGVEWLGEVPEHWILRPLCTLFRRVKRADFSNEQLLSVYRDLGVVTKASRDDNFNKASDDLSQYQLVEPGDLVINKMKAWQGSVAVSELRGIVSPAYFTYFATHAECSRYLHFLMRSLPYTSCYQAMSKGIRINQWDLEPEAHRRTPILVAPLPEQRAIAAFLDRETAKIDALIAEQEKLIELLAEKRQAVISHAVTKGLNPNAPMKPSRVEWLGDVPAHWEVTKLKFAVPALTVGIVVEPSKHYVESGVPALRSLNVKPGHITNDDMVFISASSNELHGKSKLRAGDIVAVRSGQPGTAAIVPDDLDGSNWIDLIVIRRPMDGSGAYLCWFLASDAAHAQVAHGSDGAIQQHFNISTAAQILVTRPPHGERDTIVSHLSQSIARIDDLIEEAHGAITLLRERRAALISAAVTGQIDVRHLAPEPVA